MEIIESDNILGDFLKSSREIKLSYKNEQAAREFLNLQSGLKVSHDVYFDKDKFIMSIFPIRSDKIFVYKNLPDEMIEKFKNFKPTKISIPDFDESENFYHNLKKSTFKIVEDRFSEMRGSILFKYIYKVENGIKTNYRNLYSLNDLKEPSKIRTDKRPDHPINFYDLSEIIRDKLLSPATNAYRLERLLNANSEEQKIHAINLTRLDELDIPLKKEDLIKFKNIRNYVMHFRVVTLNESFFILNLAAKYEIYSHHKMINNVTVIMNNKGV